MTVPADLCNRSLDSLGLSETIGDLNEGSDTARVMVRWYGEIMRQLLRACHWDFARRMEPLTLLNNSTGQTAGVGTGTPGMVPWIYEYAYPIDCMKARFLPWNGQVTPATPAGNITLPPYPQPVTLSPCSPYNRLTPARFLVGQDSVASFVGLAPTWADMPQYDEVQGQSANQRTVILTNVPQASLVYTALIVYPDQWDPLFRQAFVAALASAVAMAVVPDKRLAAQLRAQQIEIAKAALSSARASDGNEGSYSSDISVDWMQTRRLGTYGYGYGGCGPGLGGGLGVLGYGWSAFAFSDGSAF